MTDEPSHFDADGRAVSGRIGPRHCKLGDPVGLVILFTRPNYEIAFDWVFCADVEPLTPVKIRPDGLFHPDTGKRVAGPPEGKT